MMKDTKAAAAAKKDNTNKIVNGSNDSTSKKTAISSKDTCGNNTKKTIKESERTKEKDTTFIVLQKKMRSMQISELEGYRWDCSILERRFGGLSSQ